MRRIELLINDIRFNSNNIDENRFSDLSLVKLFNDAQEAIQAIIFTVDNGARQFTEEAVSDIVADTESYSLPSDIYSVNSISSVSRSSQYSLNQYYTPLALLSEKERRRSVGYIVKGNNILVSPIPKSGVQDGLKISYTRRLNKLSPRIGAISSFISGTSITLAAGFNSDDITLYEDYVTVVDRYGVIKQSGILIDGYVGGVILTPTTLTGISAGDYVVIGEKATTNSELPQNTEPLLTAWVERKIQAIDSSEDIKNADLFTSDEREIITNLYKKNDHDVKYPVIIDETYING